MVWRLGAVSYLNAKPLIAGLERDPSIHLTLDVPSRLAGQLDQGLVDVALVPVIDLGRKERDWRVVSDAAIGCDGETFTVRVFSRVAPERLQRLHVDGDSHTSVALADVVWREMHGRELEIVPFTGLESVEECEAVLLIGDKVVTQILPHHTIATDLGQEWKRLTGLPFVFAAWASPDRAGLDEVARKLSTARDIGVRSAAMIAADYGPGMGWPVATACRYLVHRLKFKLGPREREAMQRFLDLAGRYEIALGPRELVFA